MGTILIVVAILSVIGSLIGLTVTGIAHRKYGDEMSFKEWFSSFEIEGEPVNIQEAIDNLREELGADSPEVKEFEKIIEYAKRADQDMDEFIEAMSSESFNLKALFQAAFIATILALIIAVFLVMIGRSWRKVDPFSRKVVMGLRGLGIVFLIQTVILNLMPNPSVENGSAISELTSIAPFTVAGTAPLLSLGLLLLALSWVIEHGQKLTEDTELTI
ncbi:MAG: DUF2975 domain-containing protein [Verrucomicrobiales bacterium]|nr:DUF2975 domain-containing protein [Verrucomicrobiales bacterium]